MKKEKIVLSFIAVLLGLIVAAVAFFIYQSTKSINPSKIPAVTVTNATPSPSSSIFLSIDKPVDQSVSSIKNITITGKTTPNATLVLVTDADNQVTTPSTTGGFSLSTTLSDGANQIILTAIAPDGQEIRKDLTVTYSTEEF